MKLVGVYLAAGSSRRMGRAKQSLQMAEGVSLGGMALLQALHSELACVVVVVRESDDLAWLPDEARSAIGTGRCRVAVCKDASLGMAHSLRAGIEVAESLLADGALVMLADQPFVQSAMIGALIASYRGEAGCDFVASGDQGMPKPPAILGRSMWPAVMRLEGDAGARALFHMPAYWGQIEEAADALMFIDMDTQGQYEEALRIYKNLLALGKVT
ncbi:nucleotidyltransferase family protein [Paenibacillus roseipurpureus]|uniref:Nucleotidyltransferase family protein n=1 Tax=Paenibacillus roseopurpureus TaxID=2918901 RepID=A0AA96RL76_9BACL|nr:nucleotidyltransferase family protein [Paenibacillus sp. MBLB1832]WNR45066.1 nucleotidyltransferase family protein [Paenibacillus sp. MBLB1832]